MPPLVARSSSPSERLADGADAEPQDEEERLRDDAAGHLGGATNALAEGDRDLGDARPAPMCPPRHLDLEAVAGGGGLAQANRLEQLAAPGLEAAGQVAVRQQQHGP